MSSFLILCVLSFFVLDLSHALNENCDSNENCSVQEKTVCLNNICTCDTLWYYSGAQEKCLKYATEYGSVCYEDRQCEFFGKNASCHDNLCQCLTGYRWYRGVCQKYPSKGEDCDAQSVCLDSNNPLSLKCGKEGKCECSGDYYDRGEYCRLKSEVNEECAISSDCFPKPDIFGPSEIYSHCELGKCIQDNYSGLTSVQNYTGNSFAKSVADDDSCPNGVLANLTKKECSDCANTLYVMDSACICKQGFFLQNGKCIAELGMLDELAHYTNVSDCPIKPAKLVDNVCYCKDYWFQGSTNRECKKTTLQYTQNCMDNDWCKAMGKYAYCNTETEKCHCISLAVLNETSFYCELEANANLTGICLSDSDCGLYETCTNERCQCTDGFYKVDDSGLCLPEIGSSCEFRNCSHIENAVCSKTDELCECEENYVTDGLLCLRPATKLYDECQIEEQCKHINHTNCLMDSATLDNATTRCLCNDEYKDVNGFCYSKKYPGSMCSTQADCTIILGDTFVCRNMLCQCPIGKSLNEDNICASSSAQKRNSYTTLAVVLSILLSLRYSIE